MAMQKVTVTVTGDPSNPTLTMDPVNVDLNTGDALEWDFQDVPADCAPAIWFVSKLGELGQPEPLGSLDWLGPFQVIESRGNNVVVGRGIVGAEGEVYSYNVQLLDVNGIRKTSDATGTVKSLVAQADQDTTPMVVIRCQTEVDPQTGETRVTGSTLDGSGALRIFMGDTALWYVFGLPEGYFVTFLFPSNTDLVANSPMGPFKSFTYSRGIPGEGPGGVGVIGVGFNPPPDAPAGFYYSIDIRDASGAVVSHHDPMIDNLGQPPQG